MTVLWIFLLTWMVFVTLGPLVFFEIDNKRHQREINKE